MALKRSRDDLDDHDHHLRFHFVGSETPANDRGSRRGQVWDQQWNQDALDERGRKRFHGAFTGGFSAGYFNTVGSKEGFVPSAFVSSRTNRHKDDPQDDRARRDLYMDDEDRADAAASQKLQAIDTSTLTGMTADDPNRNAPFASLFQSTVNTAAARVMRKLGWKPGKRQSEAIMPSGPPTRAGVGFDKESSRLPTLEDSTGTAQPNPPESTGGVPTRSEKRERIRPAGMGVGVLNADDSDEDPYSMGPKLTISRQARLKKAKKTSTTIKPPPNPLLGAKPVFRPKAQFSGKRGHDGRLPLAGFEIVDELRNIVRQFLETSRVDENDAVPPPPSDWTPSQAIKENASKAITDESALSTPDSRARLMGWGGPARSIFSMMSAESRAKIAKATGRTDLPPAGTARSDRLPRPARESPLRSDQKTEPIPKVAADTAVAVLGRLSTGWTPYAEDVAKGDRYRAYLEYCSGAATEAPPCPTGFDQNQMQLELREFIRSTEVFKPMSGMMASRFTSSRPQSVLDEEKVPEDPSEAAAKAEMYGALTRRTFKFFPTALLCKRFNVLQPKGSSEEEKSSDGAESSRTAPSALLSQAMMDEIRKEAGLSSREEMEVDEMRDDGLTKTRASAEVFANVFD